MFEMPELNDLFDSFINWDPNRPQYSYNEILRLEEMLKREGIPYEKEEFLGGYHIMYIPTEEGHVCSVIEHNGSYGREEDKLEIMGLLTPEEAMFDDVVGWLTAEEVFERIQKDWEVRRLENKTDVKGDI